MQFLKVKILSHENVCDAENEFEMLKIVRQAS